MKYLRYTYPVLLVIFFLGIGNSSKTFARESQKQVLQLPKDSLKTNTVCYEVFGMDCPGCQSALEKQLKKIDGVADATASFKEKEVVIELKPEANVTEEEIHNRIKKANFTPGKKINSGENEKRKE